MFRFFRPATIVIPIALISIAAAQEQRHGRKYVPPPPTTHISVKVTKADNGKPVPNAEVIFHPMKNGKDEGSMELKTNHDGIAELNVIPQDSTVRLQVIAQGFRTFGEDYTVHGDSQDIDVKLQRPTNQLTTGEGTTMPKPATPN